jgi:hypothetical protein
VWVLPREKKQWTAQNIADFIEQRPDLLEHIGARQLEKESYKTASPLIAALIGYNALRSGRE